MSDMFKYVVWPQSAPDALCTIDALIDGDLCTRNSELNGKILLIHFFICRVGRWCTVCLREFWPNIIMKHL